MRVLHYMFGIPPVRTGGLVRYAADLMEQEMKMGIDVHLLIPGAIPINGRKKTKIKKRRNDYLQIPTYEIYHPLPIPMCNGILDIKAYTEKCGGRVFQQFLKELQPDLIHIHTFMGLHREFLVQSRRMGIPVLFTTHDYFGICPTAVMLYRGSVCRDSMWKNCGECSSSAFSKNRLFLEQSACYRMLRKHGRLTAAVKMAARWSGMLTVRTETQESEKIKINSSTAAVRQVSYSPLRNYYRSMFDMVSYFHFNSLAAKKIYEKRIGEHKGKVVNISHAGISDHRRRYRYGKTLRIGYFGSWAVHKGFFALLDACGSLYEAGCTQLELHLYSGTETRNERYVKNHPSFRADQLECVFRGIDLLAVPSLWPETFGLAALEAVSYGVPVIVSKQAGANDVLQCKNDSGGGFVYDGTQRDLKRVLKEVYENREMLARANECIVNMEYDFSYKAHVEEMLGIYRHLVKNQDVR